MIQVRPLIRRGTSGFTLLELSLAIALLAVFAVKAITVIDSTTKNTQRDLVQTDIEAQARRVLRQIGFAVMGSHPDSLDPKMAAPLNQASLKYQVSLGLSEGAVVWSDLEEVGFEEARRQLYWSDDPNAVEEQRVIWSTLVSPFLSGEIPNGMDDNGNGLIDEKGLCISVDGKAITLKLTLSRELGGGEIVESTVETVVACRNTIDGWGGAP